MSKEKLRKKLINLRKVNFNDQGINFIQLVSPTTSKIRLKKIIKDSHDMVYYISMLSTTGGKLKVSPKKILERYNKLNKHKMNPIPTFEL